MNSKTVYYATIWTCFTTRATILEHNFGYKASSLLLHLGFSREYELAVLARQAVRKARMALHKKRSKKRQRTDDGSSDYQPGGF